MYAQKSAVCKWCLKKIANSDFRVGVTRLTEAKIAKMRREFGQHLLIDTWDDQMYKRPKLSITNVIYQFQFIGMKNSDDKLIKTRK